MVRATRLVAAAVVVVLAASCSPTPAVPSGPGGTLPGAPTSEELLARDLDRPPPPDCAGRYEAPDQSTWPPEYDVEDHRQDYRTTSYRQPARATSVHHLCGSLGPSVDLAWGITWGRPDVVIAVLDSGMIWSTKKDNDSITSRVRDLATQAYLNVGELPPPLGADTHDANDDGVVNVTDYEDDPRIGDRNGNGLLDPQDLILTPEFNDGVDDDANGYVDDISGWDFLFGDNDPNDDVDYGHGGGEARDAVARADGQGDVGVCPRCRFLPVRVSDSFIADGGAFAAGVLFSVDSGASVILEALGALNNPPQAQAAIDAAYERGVPVVASMADEASKHPNLPAALNHTIPVNSITSVYDFLGSVRPLLVDDVLALNGCTNYGGITWVSVPSGGCSSEATGRGAGMVGLMLSAAREAGISPPLSPNEVAQLLRGTADDVDFATPRGANEPANEARGDFFERYPTSPGWDATFGYGRVNTFEAVRAAREGVIPPEADLVSPAWFEVHPSAGRLAVTGRVAARRSSSYSYRVEWTTGLQPPPWPGVDQWRTVAAGSGLTAPKDGVLGEIDLAEVAAAIPGGPSGPSSRGRGQPDEDRFTVRIRVVTVDERGLVGVSHKQIFVHDDPDRVVPLTGPLAGAGAASPVFADLDGLPGEELLVATDDGTLHAFRADGTEAPGWPVRTELMPTWPVNSPTAKQAGIPPLRAGFGFGAPVVADLDGDGEVEVAAADIAGNVTVWARDGRRRARMSIDRRYSDPAATDENNRLKPGIFAQVAAGDLDGDGDLELVAAALDRHVYAWHHDGAPVAGFPVLVVDPERVESVDPDTHRVRFRGRVDQGGELIATPAVGDLTGDGRAEIVVGAQEQYPDPVAVVPGIGLPGVSGNTRSYAIWGDGNLHPPAEGSPPSRHPSANAYLPGWPVALAMVKSSVLPMIGNGVATQAAIGDLDGDGEPEVVLNSPAGPVYVVDRRGRSVLGRPFGWQVALPWLGSPFGSRATSSDGGIVAAAFGGVAVGRLDDDAHPDVAVSTVGLGRTLDQLLPGRQPGDTQLMAWSGRDGAPLHGFPARTTDLAFFVTPAIVDVDGDGRAEVVAGNGVNLVDGKNADGDDAPGFPKLTGGWTVGTPGFGDLDGDGRAEMAVVRRDGVLIVWRTAATSLEGWTRFGHDGRNSGDVRAR
jgi:hypothetical protein